MIDFDVERLKQLAVTEFEIDEVRFRVQKLPAMRGFRMSEKIRTEMRNVIASLEPGMKVTVDELLLLLPDHFVDAQVRIPLFNETRFSLDHGKHWEKLSEAEDKAFQDLEVFHVYEVLVRAFAVSFFGSTGAVLSFMDRMQI